MSFHVGGFEWDEGNRTKCEKHGVTRKEIEEFFTRPIWVQPDIKHSLVEERFLAVGRGMSGRPLFVVFTLRTQGKRRVIRPISARYMHDKEIRRYGEAFTKDEE